MKKIISRLNSTPMLWVSGLFLLASFLMEYIFPLFDIHVYLPINPAWVSLLVSGIPLAYSAIERLLKGKITSALLITIAMTAAVYIGDIFAAGEVAFIMAIGELLEDRTVEKAKKGIVGLLSLVPSTGRRILMRPDGHISEDNVAAEDICPGDLIRVLPGESFPADGVIYEGNTTVDQSIMTGESLPIDKVEGDAVFTGTINRFGSVDIKVTKSFSNSSLQKMIRLVEDAENQKAPTQKTVDKWASFLVPAACIIAVITYLVFNFVLHEPEAALIRAVTVLVVFCPCALALATPTSIMAAIGQASKKGVLVKSGAALERMGTVSTIAFDKTGTLTKGTLSVSDVFPFQGTAKDLLGLAASVESRSEHPLGKAITKHVKAQKLSFSSAQDFFMVLGKGVLAKVNDQEYYCGNEELLKEYSDAMLSSTMQDTIDTLRESGKAVVLVADKRQVLGVIGLSDCIKEDAPRAISSLHAAGVKKTVLLTGDNEKSARFISKTVGIENVFSSLLPEGKVKAVKKLEADGEYVCMVGDGVNDAPALKTATVGVAMGTMGSDIAIEAADIAIMGDDITKISYLKKLSCATLFSIKFNITLSMLINFAAILLSVAGLLTPATGALVHNAGSVLVVLNAARLYDKKI